MNPPLPWRAIAGLLAAAHSTARRQIALISPGATPTTTRSTTMQSQTVEHIVQKKGLNAPRVSFTDLTSNVVATEIVKHVTPSGQVLRWAVLTTRNGFAVTGRPSCSVSSANDDQGLGEQIAIDNARQELWPLMGYALKERMAQQGGAQS